MRVFGCPWDNLGTEDDARVGIQRKIMSQVSMSSKDVG